MTDHSNPVDNGPVKSDSASQKFALGDHVFREMDRVDAAFGAGPSDYPDMDGIPEPHRLGRSKGCEAFSGLFYGGGRLSDHGFALRDDVDAAAFYSLLRALMSSFAPKHELKEATCGWLIETYCRKGGAA